MASYVKEVTYNEIVNELELVIEGLVKRVDVLKESLSTLKQCKNGEGYVDCSEDSKSFSVYRLVESNYNGDELVTDAILRSWGEAYEVQSERRCCDLSFIQELKVVKNKG